MNSCKLSSFNSLNLFSSFFSGLYLAHISFRSLSFKYINPFPIFSEAPSTIPIYQFFFFCLSNTNISNKPYAFKLYDCKTQGYNLSDLIYSFIGFTGPVIILINHYNEDGDSIIFRYFSTNKYGLFLHHLGSITSFKFLISFLSLSKTSLLNL